VNPWLARQPRSGAARCTLFCFAHAGGSSSAWRELGRALEPSGVSVSGVELPGRAARYSEPVIRRIEQVVDQAWRGLGDELCAPYALLGHSYGALVAFELARRIEQEAAAVAPARLFVSGTPPAHAREPKRRHQLPDEALAREMVGLGGLPREVVDDPEVMRFFLPIIRGDLEAHETHGHVAGPPLRAPISAIAADADDEAGLVDMERWREATASDFELHALAGDHFAIYARVDEVARIVAATLGLELPA
jgi:surfactin synthase thioesterase subunit